jgi:hypothetical protein
LRQLLGAFFDAVEHPLFHHKGYRMNYVPDAAYHHGAGAQNQAGGTVSLRDEDKLVQIHPFAVFLVPHHNRLVGVELGDDIRWRGKFTGAHQHRVADFEILPFGVDAVGVGVGAVRQGFEPVVTVPAALIGPNLQ